MQKVTSSAELKEAILKLEYKQKEQWLDFKGNLNVAFEALKPINLIKATYNQFISTPHVAENLIGSTLGLTSGLITKKIIVKRSGGVLRNFAGGLAQMLITNFVTRHAGTIKTIGAGLIHKIFFNKKMQAGNA